MKTFANGVGAVAVLVVFAGTAGAQSLFVQGAAKPGIGMGGNFGGVEEPVKPGMTLAEASLLSIEPPRPREYRKHDQVTIIVDEVSRQEAEQSLKTDKTFGIDAQLGAVIDPWELLEARLRQADIDRLRLIDAAAKQQFDGKGKFQRNDRFSMKIQAEIIDVKPNGVLVLEARKTIDRNGEITMTVLSGSCRQEDITSNNSIFSSQMANLMLVSRMEGQVDRAGSKGLISRVLETVFAF